MGSTVATGRADGRAATRLRNWLIKLLTALLAAPAAVVAAPFWMVAGATRRLPRLLRLEPQLLAWMDAMQYEPVVGWRTRPNLNGYLEADGPFRFTTDAEGWRDASLGIDDAELLVFGDSYAFGQGVNDADLYSRHTNGIRTKALGSNGYSMVHAVLWMELLAERLAGRHVVWFVYLGNDLYDNLRPNYGRYRMPFVTQRDDGWQIETSNVSEQQWPFPERHPDYAAELARLCTPSRQTDRALAAANYLIDWAHAVCSAAEARLSIVTVPRRDQIDPERLEGLRALSPDPVAFDAQLLDNALRSHCAEIGIPLVALADHLSHRDYFDVDIHWTTTGHRRVGRILSGLHQARRELGDQERAASEWRRG